MDVVQTLDGGRRNMYDPDEVRTSNLMLFVFVLSVWSWDLLSWPFLVWVCMCLCDWNVCLAIFSACPARPSGRRKAQRKEWALRSTRAKMCMQEEQLHLCLQ